MGPRQADRPPHGGEESALSALPEHADRTVDLEPLTADSRSRPLNVAQAVVSSTAMIVGDPAVVATPAVAAAES